MNIKTIKTIHAVHLNNFKTIGVPYVPLENTTLNQLYSVAEEEAVHNEYPLLRYVMFGIGGAKGDCSTSNELGVTQVPHSPNQSSVYNAIPCLARELNDDISPEMRKNYRMRTLKTVGGKTIVCYMARPINMTNVVPVAEVQHIENNVTTTSLYIPELGDLTSPIPIDINNIDLNKPKGDCLISTAKVVIPFTENDIQEMLNAYVLLGGKKETIFLSEVALISAVDRKIQGTIGTGTGLYDEAICAQINYFHYDVEMLTRDRSSFNINIDLGSAELKLLNTK